jgi:hypothetical protein
VNFFLDLVTDSGNLDSLDEGVELGYRISDNEWIPLAWFSSRNNRDNPIKVGELVDINLIVRGFSVPFYHRNLTNVTLKLCDSEITENGASLSFRWLQTVLSVLNPNVDDISIDDVHISIRSPAQQTDMLLVDNFNDQMNIRYVVSKICLFHIIILYLKIVHSSSKWTDIDRVSIENNRLLFGAESPTFGPLPPAGAGRPRRTIISRGISTVPLTLNIPTISTTSATVAMDTTEMSAATITNTEEVDTGPIATTEMSTTTKNADIPDAVAMATTETSTTTITEEDDILEHTL